MKLVAQNTAHSEYLFEPYIEPEENPFSLHNFHSFQKIGKEEIRVPPEETLGLISSPNLSILTRSRHTITAYLYTQPLSAFLATKATELLIVMPSEEIKAKL